MDTVEPRPVRFKGTLMKTDQTIYALDYSSDSSLVLVARENDSPTSVDPSYIELWVWSKHVIRN